MMMKQQQQCYFASKERKVCVQCASFLQQQATRLSILPLLLFIISLLKSNLHFTPLISQINPINKSKST